jgi:hypothetical protein
VRALSIGGNANFTVRSRQGRRMRSRQSRIAVGSPARASSTALRVNASDSPASNAAAASVALLREPLCRPGLPDRPFSNARPRGFPRSLFLLFYLVEIRHPQLLQITISHPVTS